MFTLPTFDFAPYRLSGVVYGVLLNDPATFAALGAAVHDAPYRAPPSAPVLCVKPRNTFAGNGDPLCIPSGFDQIAIGARLGLVIGRTACRVPQSEALSFVAAYLMAIDVSLPQAGFYRPAIRFRARDHYCPIGASVVPAHTIKDPDGVPMRVFIDGVKVQDTGGRGRIRSAARLLSDVTEFMTLQPGDVLLLGSSHDEPLALAGQTVRVEVDGVGQLCHPVLTEEVTA